VGRPHVDPRAELGEHPCVLFRRRQSPAMHDAIVRAAERAGAVLRVAEEVDDPLHTAMVLRSRPLVAFGSAPTAARSAAHGLVGIPLTGPSPRLSLRVAWRHGDTAPAVTAVLDTLAAVGPFSAVP
jgi:hypothetical protein